MKNQIVVALVALSLAGCAGTTTDQCEVYVKVAAQVAREIANIEAKSDKAKERIEAYTRILEVAAPLGCSIPALKLE